MNQIFQRVEADIAVGITELKRNPAAVMKVAEGQAVAVLSHNRVVGYVISPAAYDGFLAMAEDLQDIEVIGQRANEVGILVDIDDL